MTDSSKWLYELINEENTVLVDNHRFCIEENWFYIDPLAKTKIPIKRREKNHKRSIKNDDENLWNFLNFVANDINNKIKNSVKDSILIFNNNFYEHNSSDPFIRLEGTGPTNFYLSTGNLVGYIKKKDKYDEDYTLKIGSRFGDSFLKFMIAEAEGFLEINDLGGYNNHGNIDWLLAYFWYIKLKSAYRLGIPKKYISIRDRCSSARGRMDALDYYINNKSGKYLCSYREQSYSNAAVCLFTKAYEAVKHYSFCNNARNIYTDFLVASSGLKLKINDILNVPYFTNPYYNSYNILINLSKMILRHKIPSFDSQKDTSAFIFDISMLFEYLIRKILCRTKLTLLPKNHDFPVIPTGSISNNVSRHEYNRKLKPDIVFETCDGYYIFDVKYKMYDHKYGVLREDLFQMHTYVGQYGNKAQVKGCGFIFPVAQNEKSKCEVSDYICQKFKQQDKEINFYVTFLKIADDKTDKFNMIMRENCYTLIKTFESIIK